MVDTIGTGARPDTSTAPVLLGRSWLRTFFVGTHALLGTPPSGGKTSKLGTWWDTLSTVDFEILDLRFVDLNLPSYFTSANVTPVGVFLILLFLRTWLAEVTMA